MIVPLFHLDIWLIFTMPCIYIYQAKRDKYKGRDEENEAEEQRTRTQKEVCVFYMYADNTYRIPVMCIYQSRRALKTAGASQKRRKNGQSEYRERQQSNRQGLLCYFFMKILTSRVITYNPLEGYETFSGVKQKSKSKNKKGL